MSTPSIDPERLDEAVALARAAGRESLRWYQTPGLHINHKGDGSPVTEADRAAERLLRSQIAALYPHDTIIGEEEPDHRGKSPNRWVLDPIDGTKAFTHGVPFFANLVAYFDQHGPAIGVINLPALDETVYAGRGLGCFFNGARCHVSTTTEIADAYVCTSGLDNWPPAKLTELAGAVTLRTWGDAYGYALVATGRVDAMIDPQIAYYDVAAMLTILPEAGGRFSDLGGVVRADGGSGLGTNGHLHDALLAQWATS